MRQNLGICDASVHLDSYKTYYVARHERDKSNVAGMIAEDLRRRGLEAEFGPERSALREEKVVVTYEDRWAWDITTYMLSLKVDFRDAKTDELLASVQSYRPSLQRRSPEEMVREVLAEIFGTR